MTPIYRNVCVFLHLWGHHCKLGGVSVHSKDYWKAQRRHFKDCCPAERFWVVRLEDAAMFSPCDEKYKRMAETYAPHARSGGFPARTRRLSRTCLLPAPRIVINADIKQKQYVFWGPAFGSGHRGGRSQPFRRLAAAFTYYIPLSTISKYYMQQGMRYVRAPFLQIYLLFNRRNVSNRDPYIKIPRTCLKPDFIFRFIWCIKYKTKIIPLGSDKAE